MTSPATRVLNLYLSMAHAETHDETRAQQPPKRKRQRCSPHVPLCITIPAAQPIPFIAIVEDAERTIVRPPRRNSCEDAALLDLFVSLYVSARTRTSTKTTTSDQHDSGGDWDSFPMPTLTESNLRDETESDSDMDTEVNPSPSRVMPIPLPVHSVQQYHTSQAERPSVFSISCAAALGGGYPGPGMFEIC